MSYVVKKLVKGIMTLQQKGFIKVTDPLPEVINIVAKDRCVAVIFVRR